MSFTKEQIKQLEEKLDAKHVSERKQSGVNLSYLEGYHVIDEANRIFGFDGWNYSIEIESVKEQEVAIGAKKTPGHYIGVVAKVSVNVETSDTKESFSRFVNREDVGFGSGRAVSYVDAHELAYKEAVTDGLKRALRSFGNQFGNALYDKTQKNVETKSEEKPKKSKKTKKKEEPVVDFIKMIDECGTEEELINFRKKYKSEILEQDNSSDIKDHFNKRKKEVNNA